MPWVTLDGEEVEGVGEVIWRGVYEDDSPVMKGVEIDKFTITTTEKTIPVTEDKFRVWAGEHRIVAPPTLEEAVKMATMDIKLDVSDFKTTLEEFQSFIHSELEAVESHYSQNKHETDAMAVEFKHFSDNVIFLFKQIEDKLDVEVADRMELAIRLEKRITDLESIIIGMVGEL